MDKEKLITITKADFAKAVSHVVIKNTSNPDIMAHGDSALTFCMGGMVFAREVMDFLFGEETDDE